VLPARPSLVDMTVELVYTLLQYYYHLLLLLLLFLFLFLVL